MDLTKAIELFEELKRRISEHGDYLRESEYRTRIMLVDPLLQLLGWNVEDFYSVEIEFRTTQSANERADYVLKKDRSQVAIVEAKKLGAPMTPKERRQAKEYADYAGVSQCVLTDGARWMLYDLNQGRNPDTMQPWIELDIENHEPEQLILHSLTLWQRWFTLEAGSSPIGNLIFGSSVDDKPPDPPPKGDGNGKGDKKAPTCLEVTMPDGERIDHDDAIETFAEVIQKLGINQVRSVYPSLISNSKSSKHGYRTGKHYIRHRTGTKTKKQILETVADRLGEQLEVKIVPKD